MTFKQVSASYAKALFKIGGSSQQIRKREDDLQIISEMIKKNPKIINILQCPELTVQARLETLEKIVTIPLEDSVKQLISLLLKRSKISQIGQITMDYTKLVINSLEEIDIEVASSEPLSENTLQFLRAKLETQFQKKIVFFEMIEPSLLGGFTLSVHNQMLDLSIKKKIINFKKAILKG